MVQIDKSDTLRVVQELSNDSLEYARRFVLWLGIGSGGGAVAVLTFAAQLPNPDFALRALLPSLALFCVGVVAAGSSLFAASRRQSAAAEHHGSAFNRDEIAKAIRQTPQVFASAQRVADEMNRRRDDLIKKHDGEHDQAEKAWKRRSRWNAALVGLVFLSSLAFVGGITWPIAYIAGGRGFSPASATHQPPPLVKRSQ